jgi:hypothetical protein
VNHVIELSLAPEPKQDSIQIRTSRSARSTRLEQYQTEDQAGSMTLFTITQADEPGATDNAVSGQRSSRGFTAFGRRLPRV